jgi:hypothetical protein
MPVRFGGRGKAFFVPTPIVLQKIRPVGYGMIDRAQLIPEVFFVESASRRTTPIVAARNAR